jgi:hypothetical protein
MVPTPPHPVLLAGLQERDTGLFEVMTIKPAKASAMGS